MRRKVRGYSDMGRIRVPPLPPALLLTDRGTGQLWHVSFTLEGDPTRDGLGRVTLTDELPRCNKRPCLVYKAYEEPYIGTNPYKRLIVRDGHLGIDVEEPPRPVQDMDNAPLSIVKGFNRDIRVFVDYTGPQTARVAWTPWSDFDG